MKDKILIDNNVLASLNSKGFLGAAIIKLANTIIVIEQHKAKMYVNASENVIVPEKSFISLLVFEFIGRI